MKKILSLVIFTAALVWTWNLIHSSSAIGFETHSGIQVKLAELIKATLAEKKPTAADIAVTRLWTEALNDNKVRAVFAYTFSETDENGEKMEQIIEGEAVLHREPSQDGTDLWALQSVRTTNDIVSFSEGSVVTPVAPETETAPEAVTAPAEPGKEKQ